MSSVSFVAPCYNEQDTIRRFVLDWHKQLSQDVADFEMIIVNDCSKDKTSSILDELAGGIPQLVVIHNEKNLRHGGALMRGMKAATKEYVFWTDSDYANRPQDFGELWRHKEGVDAVWGNRRIIDRDTKFRVLFTTGNMLVTFLLFGEIFRDPNCPFKLFKHEKLMPIITRLRPHNFITTTKIAIQARKNRLSIKEIPVVFLKRQGHVPVAGLGKHIPIMLSGIRELIHFRFSGE